MADITFAKPTFTDGVSQVSAATFQPFADALDEIAHKANRTGILDADTVSGCGIGVNTVAMLTTDAQMNALYKGGNYFFYMSTSAVFPINKYIFFSVYPSDTETTVWQRAITQDGNVYERILAGGSGTWMLMYDRSNGGQPPAAKPNVTADAAGEWLACTQYVGGAAGDTGTWAFIQFTAAGAYSTCGISNGGTNKGAGVLMMCWKLTT